MTVLDDTSIRAPRHTDTIDVRVAIVGTGFSGIGAAIRLKQAGITDFVLLERADDLGGTWRDNHYPGCCCDVPSHLYSFSFELNPRWTRGFAPQWEIRDYLRWVAAKHQITDRMRFRHEVTRACWDDAAQRWDIETTGGRLTARVLVSGGGALSDPKIPDLPGLDSFPGTMFHSARWDHAHDLAGERVAVIGTGASAIQFVPAIQPRVGRLHLFQRTPPWVIPRFDHQITRVEHGLLKYLPFATALVRGAIYGALEVRVVGFRNPRVMRVADRTARWHLRRQVRDPELRRKLTPDYVIGCKRILVSDDYYPSLTEPNVEVLTGGVAEVRGREVVSGDGEAREVDTIIFGTGFEATEPPIARRIIGRDGRSLGEHWRENGMSAYLGTTVAGFPNLFVMTGPNTGLGHTSMIYMIESQLNYLVDALRHLDAARATSADVRRPVQNAYNGWVQGQMEGTVWTAGSCRSWYLDDTGRNTTLWPGYTIDYRRRTRHFDPADYTLTPRG
jgi:cation diffusion facilitator CzcD-associated flavoprotein CzcO